MNKVNFSAILQVALWKNEGMTELEIRKLLADLTSNYTIKAGIKLCDYLNSIRQEETQTYNKNCSRCRKKTPHTAVFLSRRRGVRLRCCICNYINQRFYNLNKLQEANKND